MLNFIEFKSVNLIYSSSKMIGPIDFNLAQGECLALVGPNGAGKSSIIQLLLNLRPPDS